MNLKQAKQIDILLSEFKDTGRLYKPKFREESDKLKHISDKELDELIAIIRFEQVKLNIIVLTGVSNTFIINREQVITLENIGGFEKIYKKYRTESSIKWVTLIIVVVTFILALIQECRHITISVNSTSKPLEQKTQQPQLEELRKTPLSDSLDTHCRISKKVHCLKKDKDSLN
jgi:hypothetical protein